MNKRIALLVALFMVTLMINAVPVKKGNWKTLRLVDGSYVKAQLKGDETLHYWESEEGVRYVPGENEGTYVVATTESLQKKMRVRRANTRAVGLHKARVNQRKTIYQGKKKGLMILTEFKDKSFVDGHDVAKFSKVANEIGYSEYPFKGSVKDYFLAQSNGQFELDFDVVGPVKISRNSSYYAGSDGLERATTMIREATLAAEDLVDFSDYDWDGDGEVEQIYVLYAGKGQHDGGGSGTVWPHEWSMSDGYESKIKVDGVYVNTYSCGCELDGEGKLAGIGLLCHEYSHCMGIMDMYDTSDGGGNFGMYNWDIMDYGCYNGDGYLPCGYTSYEKWLCGWLEPIELKEDTTITDMKALSEHGDAYVIYNDNFKDEYYLLENRKRTGWDASLDGDGLLVIHVDYDELIWYNNVINTTGSFKRVDGYTQDFSNDHQRLTIFHADNCMGYGTSDSAGDLYPYLQKDSLTTKSTPAASVYNVNTDGSFNMNKGLRNIRRNGDGTISFDFALLPKESIDPEPESKYFFAETFDQCNGTGGNDGVFSGQVASSAFIPDMEGWTSTRKYGGLKCAKFGNSGTNGATESPFFVLDGDATLTFKAAAFGNDGNQLDVYLGNELLGIVYLSNTEWTTYEYEISGSGIKYLRFVPDRRFFLDEVYVKKPIDTGIMETEVANKRTDTRIYGLDGRCVGTDWNALPHGIYIYQGKKIGK